MATLLGGSEEGTPESSIDLRIVQRGLATSRPLEFPYHQDRNQQMCLLLVEGTDKSLLSAVNLKA
jgi:hypothetical protein